MSVGEKNTSEVLEGLQVKGDIFTKLSVMQRKRQADLEGTLLRNSLFQCCCSLSNPAILIQMFRCYCSYRD